MNHPHSQAEGSARRGRHLLRRIARRGLPRTWLTAPGLRTLLGLRSSEGRPLDRIAGLDVEYSLDSVIGQLLYAHGRFETTEADFMAACLRRRPAGAVMIDAGANIGLHSLQAARVDGVARVFAFEPARSTFAMLTRNIARNGLGGVVTAQPQALSDQPGTATFHFCADDAYSSLTPDDRRPVAQSYEVEVTTIDTWMAANAVERVDLIKIDVEGNEPAVIAGARATLERYRPELMVEIYQGNRTGFSAEKLIRTVCDCGYAAFVLVDGVPVPFERHDDANFNYYFRARR